MVEAAEVGAGDLPFVALVSGEAGIGKTRLLREFAAALPDDVTVLAAQAQPGSIGRPHHVVSQLAAPGDGAMAPIDVVRAAAEAGRVVLMVEDLHWADADSVAVIDSIAQSPLPRLVLIGTYRPSDLSRGAPGGELVLRLERRHAVDQVRLDRLDRSQVASMLAGITGKSVGSASVEAVHRRSGGIPFVIEELVRAAPADCDEDLASAQLPWSLEEAVRQQVAGLAHAERTVVEALAVFGRPASFDVLAEIVPFDEAELLDALRALVARGVVVEPYDDHFWFDHALVADAVVQQLLGRERRHLHERAFAALHQQPTPDAAALARHAQGAGHYDEMVDIARTGARTYLDNGASFQALRLAGDALAEAPDDLELLAVATEAAWRLDFTDEALTYARRWVDRSGEGPDAAEALRFLTRLYLERGMLAERDQSIRRMEALAAELPAGHARARVLGALAQITMLVGDSEDAVRWADRAITEADALGDEYVSTQARIERGSALNVAVDRETARQVLVDAIDRARRLGNGVLEARGINNLLELIPLQSPEARNYLDALYRLTARIGFDKLSRDATHWELELAFSRGDLGAYRRAMEEGLPRWHRQARDESYGKATALQINLALEEGRTADARRLFESTAGRSMFDACNQESLRTELSSVVTFAALTNDEATARAALDGFLGKDPLRDGSFVLDQLVGLADALLTAGVTAAEVRALDERFADHPAMPQVRAHVSGLVLAAEGRHADACAAFQGVLADPDPSLAVPVRATLRVAWASALVALGDRAAALREARYARDVELATWPGWRRDRADALLRRLEGPTRIDGVLTAREREVALLIAEGLTNGQLADRLYISPKTAAVHVSNILTKLGLSGRAEVAAWVVRTGLAPSTAA
jgi:DNA-binding CsgD family transcriptional regulator/tetratricopeptide (TPR) repeat protein